MSYFLKLSQFRNTNYQGQEAQNDKNKFGSNIINLIDRNECLFLNISEWTKKNKAYYHAYAVSIFGWKCIICNFEAQDQIGLENLWLADEKVVYIDQLDQSKWGFCNICKKSYASYASI